MSKFVTYGATETLDNDQKFIIDSDRTGPGSITAKDAASSLLSKWAGFDTFEEAVQNTISNNQEFIDRDAAIRSETADLKKKIVTTFPAKDASGAVATFESEFEDAPLKSCIVRVEPVQDLHGYDSPWVGGGGKNIFDPSRYTVVSSGNNRISLDGETYTMTWSNCAIVMQTKDVQEFEAGDYAFIGNGTNLNYLTAFAYAVSDNHTIMSKNLLSGATFTATEPFYIAINGNYEHPGTAVFNFQLERSTTIHPWTPYENICPISGFTGCEVQRTGKNLLNADTYYGDYKQSDGSYLLSASNLSIILIPLKTFIGKTVTFSADATIGETTNLRVRAFINGRATNGTPATNNATSTISLTATPVTDDDYIHITYGSGGSNPVTLRNVQLEEGSAVTTYESFGQTYPITFPTEAGTVYGGYVDVTGGELVVDRYFANVSNVINKSVKEGTGYFWFNTSGNIGIPAIKGRNAKLISNRLNVYYNVNEGTSDGLITFYVNGIIRWKEHGEMTLAEYRAYLAENPFELCYELAEPIHYPLTATEIRTLLGQNNIWANTGDTAVEYLMSDVSWYVEKKLRAFQSVLAGVEDSAAASKNYSANTYLIFNDDIYRVTKTITAGETIEEGVNVTKTTVAEQLMALAQA